MLVVTSSGANSRRRPLLQSYPPVSLGIDTWHTSGYTIGMREVCNMGVVKTAISIEKPLFEEMETLAEEMEVSRSYLFALAAREFVQRHKSQKLLDAINLAYGGSPDAAEEKLPTPIRSSHREAVKGQW